MVCRRLGDIRWLHHLWERDCSRVAATATTSAVTATPFAIAPTASRIARPTDTVWLVLARSSWQHLLSGHQ